MSFCGKVARECVASAIKLGLINSLRSQKQSFRFMVLVFTERSVMKYIALLILGLFAGYAFACYNVGGRLNNGTLQMVAPPERYNPIKI